MTRPSIFPPLTPDGCSAGPVFGRGWDQATIGGLLIPGHARVQGGGLKLKIDNKSKSGADGGNITLHGLDPQAFDLEVTMWTNEQLDEMRSVCQRLLPQRPQGPGHRATPPVAASSTVPFFLGAPGETTLPQQAPGTIPFLLARPTPAAAIASSNAKASAAAKKKTTPGRAALTFDHPSVRHLGTMQVLVTGIGPLIADGRMRKVTIHLHHWLPAKGGLVSVQTPTTSGPQKNTQTSPENPLPTAGTASPFWSPPENAIPSR